MFNEMYKNKKVLVTGHNGFKGSWLVLWLQYLGAEVYGVSLPPDKETSHWGSLSIDIEESTLDITHPGKLTEIVLTFKPEIIFHLAAQSLVRRSYREPRLTWSTNVMGTVELMEACRTSTSVRSVVVVTTDKCYENREWFWGYRENDILGGHDPYSYSKAATEFVVDSYRKSFFAAESRIGISTARAGNVIGGGDWSEERLIPDIARSVLFEKPVEIRSPHSTRPWQHVLDPISGYLILGQKMYEGQAQLSGAWNFGPDKSGNKTVLWILEQIKKDWDVVAWNSVQTNDYHESQLLQLDSSKANQQLGWSPTWGIYESVKKTVEWYKRFYEDRVAHSLLQLKEFVGQASENKASWV